MRAALVFDLTVLGAGVILGVGGAIIGSLALMGDAVILIAMSAILLRLERYAE